MNEMTQGPGQGMIDTTHVIAEQPHGDTCHVARGILRSPATFYHEYIIFHSILIQWQLILYLYSSFKSRLLSAPSHTNDINITIYLADSAISIITNGDQADKYWYPPISGTNESRPPPPPALQIHLVQYSLAVVPSFTSLWVRADMQHYFWTILENVETACIQAKSSVDLNWEYYATMEQGSFYNDKTSGILLLILFKSWNKIISSLICHKSHHQLSYGWIPPKNISIEQKYLYYLVRLRSWTFRGGRRTLEALKREHGS